MRKIKGKNINFKMLYYIKKDCSTTKYQMLYYIKKLLFNIDKDWLKSQKHTIKKPTKTDKKMRIFFGKKLKNKISFYDRKCRKNLDFKRP